MTPENKIPTAEEILLKHSTTLTDGTILCSHNNRVKAMIEFARLHCAAQQKAIIEKGYGKHYEDAFDKNPSFVDIEPESVINAYPIDLIK